MVLVMSRGLSELTDVVGRSDALVITDRTSKKTEARIPSYTTKKQPTVPNVDAAAPHADILVGVAESMRQTLTDGLLGSASSVSDVRAGLGDRR